MATIREMEKSTSYAISAVDVSLHHSPREPKGSSALRRRTRQEGRAKLEEATAFVRNAY
jgi:hypothetical protein